KGSIVLAVTFAAGLGSGVFYERSHRRSHEPVAAGTHDLMHRLTRDLDLDSAQQESVRRILARHQLEVDSTWHALQPHIRTTLDAALTEMGSVLRPEQTERFRQLTAGRHATGRH